MKSCSSRGKFNSVRKKVPVRKTVEPLLCTVNLCTKFLFGGNRDSDRNLCCETDAAIPIESYDIFTLQGRDRARYRDRMENLIPYGNDHTGPRHGQGPKSIVSHCSSPIPCSGPSPVPVQCE